jgi:hypothetical protein
VVQEDLGSTEGEIYEIHGSELWRRRKSFFPVNRFVEWASRDNSTSAFRGADESL